MNYSNPLPKQVYQAVKLIEPHLPDPERPWLLSISGGLDSMVLWYLCEAWIQLKRRPVTLVLLHISYPFRKAAQKEKEYLETQANQFGRPFYCFDARADTYLPGESVEAQSRQIRLEFYKEMLKPFPDGVILTGQHNQDTLENMFLRVWRQASWWTWFQKSKLPMPTVAPLTSLTRAHFENVQPFIPFASFQDHTNTDLNYRRNSVRHHLLPELETLLGECTKGFSEVCDLQKDLDHSLLELANQTLAQHIGPQWQSQPELSFKLLQHLRPGVFELCIWVWLSNWAGREGVNMRQLTQVIQSLRQPDKGHKLFEMPSMGTLIVKSDRILLSQHMQQFKVGNL